VTLFLILREERGLRAFENRVLRSRLGLKRDEITGGWKKLLSEELRDVYFLSSIITMTIQRERDGQGM
jgi:hypothetical protein